MAVKRRILFIAPEDAFRLKVEGRLVQAGFAVHAEAEPDEAVRALADKGAAVVLLTASAQREKSIALLARLTAAAPKTPVILLEPGGDVDFVMRARDHGVFDEVLIPFEFSELLTKIEAALPGAGRP